MVSSKDNPPKRQLIPRLLVLASAIATAVALAACGSSSDSSSSESSGSEVTTGETTEASGGNQETTVFAEGVPTLKELYEGSEEEPPSTGPPAQTDKYVAVISCGLEIEGCKEGTDRFVEATKALGWKTKIFDGRANVNNGFANAIRTGLATSPDGMALLGINCPEVKTSVEEIKAADVAIASYAGEDCGTGAEEFWSFPQLYNKNVSSSIESYEEYGEFQAAYLINATEGKAKYLQVRANAGFGLAIAEGQDAVMAKCAECELLESLEFEGAETVPGGALFTRFETLLTKYPEADAVLIGFDSDAVGLAKVIVDAGRKDELFVVSGEGNKEALRVIREEAGINAIGAASSFGWTAWGLADNLNRFFAGEEAVPPGNGYVSISKDRNMMPDGESYETPVDYKGAYEAIWSGK